MGNFTNSKVGPKIKDITGYTFGRIQVIQFLGHREYKNSRAVMWLCQCECDNATTFAIRGSSLTSGGVESCGCIGIEKAIKNKTTHGRYRTTEYRSWYGMKARCLCRGDASYNRYGGRGILVCEHWLKFENFFEDMGLKPSPKHSIDRIDNNGNYSCGHCDECVANGWFANCRWATKEEQARNTRRKHLIFFRGETRTLMEWSEIIGLPYSVLRARIFQLKWPLEKAFVTPVDYDHSWSRRKSVIY